MIKECSCCGKEIIVLSSNYLYKRKVKGKVFFQCSYSCYREEGGDTGIYEKGGKSKNYNKH